MELVDELGFEPVDAGTIDESWRQQPGAPVYGTDLDAKGLTKALADASRERAAGWWRTESIPLKLSVLAGCA
jgi:hypothetical protein